jgi:hypothetical protein
VCILSGQINHGAAASITDEFARVSNIRQFYVKQFVPFEFAEICQVIPIRMLDKSDILNKMGDLMIILGSSNTIRAKKKNIEESKAEKSTLPNRKSENAEI